MAIRTVRKGEMIHVIGEKIMNIDILMKGTVHPVQIPELLLETGDSIGVSDLGKSVYSSSYQALEDVSLISYPYTNSASLTTLLRSQKDLPYLLITSQQKQICRLLQLDQTSLQQAELVYAHLSGYYDSYKQMCQSFNIPADTIPAMEHLAPFTCEGKTERWMFDFYTAIEESSKEDLKDLFLQNSDISAGFLFKTAADYRQIAQIHILSRGYATAASSLMLSSTGTDCFALFSELNYRLIRAGKDSADLTAVINRLSEDIEQNPYIDQDLFTNRLDGDTRKTMELTESVSDDSETVSEASITPLLQDSVTTILDYAGCPEDINQLFRTLLDRYVELEDKASTEDSAIKLRRDLAGIFYEVYISAFQISIMDKQELPVILRMFFLFGYADERLVQPATAACLYQLAKTLQGNAACGIYTFYEWLVAVYQEEKTPSRNEFDTDYDAYVHELRRSGKIDAETENRMNSDGSGKVMYELKNMFPLVNKMTFGTASSYCPIFCEANIAGTLDTSLVTAARLTEALDTLRHIDYSAYYRETLYANEEQAVTREYIQVEVLPDILLMPTLGTRGVMWQEIEGRRRTTPARMMLPIFCMTDLQTAVIRLTGEYRWEMCKRIQGARWNDVSDRSLTSEYFDYIQFYRKNNALSNDAKEKLRQSLQRAKNSYKESFVRDYITWITFEALGAPRLNKVARMILYTYCPFTKTLGERLGTNPLYSEAVEYHKLQQKRQLHHFDLLTQKVKASKCQLPQEILSHIDFLNE